jgi:hypothetical protein
VLALWPCTKYNIRGKVVASPKFRPWWVLWALWVCVCSWLVRAPKVFQLRTNLLFSLCRSVWIIDLFINLPNPHPGVPTRPSTPKMLRTKERAQLLLLLLFSSLDSQLSPSRNLRVCHMVSNALWRSQPKIRKDQKFTIPV